MQVLEGPEEAINELEKQIYSDPQHRGIITLLKEPCETRLFGNWSMAFKNIDELSEEERSAFSPFLNEPFTAESFGDQPHKVTHMLLSFKENMR